jgi:hypothetical protein
MKKIALIVSASLLMMVFSVATQATTYVKYTKDNSAKLVAYFTGTTLLGFHLIDNKCDGHAVFAGFRFREGGQVKRSIDQFNKKGCGKDLWIDLSHSGGFPNITSMFVCRDYNFLRIAQKCTTFTP